MGFFNEVWADIFQLISLPLELLGFGLVIIEVFRPDVLDKMEAWVDETTQHLLAGALKIRGIGPITVFHMSDEIKFEHRRVVIGRGLLMTGCLYAFLYLGIYFPVSDQAAIANILRTIFLLLIIGAVLYWTVMGLPRIIMAFASLFLHTLDRISNGYALASFGVLLASIGLLLEFYQVITMLIAP